MDEHEFEPGNHTEIIQGLHIRSYPTSQELPRIILSPLPPLPRPLASYKSPPSLCLCTCLMVSSPLPSPAQLATAVTSLCLSTWFALHFPPWPIYVATAVTTHCSPPCLKPHSQCLPEHQLQRPHVPAHASWYAIDLHGHYIQHTVTSLNLLPHGNCT